MISIFTLVAGSSGLLYSARADSMPSYIPLIISTNARVRLSAAVAQQPPQALHTPRGILSGGVLASSAIKYFAWREWYYKSELRIYHHSNITTTDKGVASRFLTGRGEFIADRDATFWGPNTFSSICSDQGLCLRLVR